VQTEDLHILRANMVFFSVIVIENSSTFTTGICTIAEHREQRWF